MPELSPIEAHERTIGQIFSDDYAFEIPPYQRPYAWEEDNARELLSDLLDAMDNEHASGGVYFLGSIVLIKGPASPDSRVVDGQQRLTTFTILLSVLRDLTSDVELKIERRTYVHQKASKDKGTEDRFRMLLRERDRPFFQKTIQLIGATAALPSIIGLEGSQLRIVENALYFCKQLAAIGEAKRDQLFAFIIQRCYLVVVAVPTADAARRIFTVLNARGLDLTATDILKADLLERAGAQRETDLAKRWEAIELELGRDPFVELFTHIRMIYERDKPRSALESAFPDVVEVFRANPDAFISNVLEPSADAFELLRNDGEIRRQFGYEAAKAVRSLQRIDSKDWLPPALLRLQKRSVGDDKAVAAFLIRLERLAYYLFVTRADVNDRIARFAGVMDEFEPRLGKQSSSEGLELAENESKEFVVALDGQLYRKSRVCKPVLQRLDEALSAGGAWYDEFFSIEHVLPQTVAPGSEWDDLFPTDELRATWTHRLANLVILTRRINTRASNWKFERKKREYFRSPDGTSPFPLTQGVLETPTWTAEHLEQRQGVLVTKLCQVWDLTV